MCVGTCCAVLAQCRLAELLLLLTALDRLHSVSAPACRDRLERHGCLFHRRQDPVLLSVALDRPCEGRWSDRQSVRREHSIQSGASRHHPRRQSTKPSLQLSMVSLGDRKYPCPSVVFQRDSATTAGVERLATEGPRRRRVLPGCRRTVRAGRGPCELRAGGRAGCPLRHVSARKWVDSFRGEVDDTTGIVAVLSAVRLPGGIYQRDCVAGPPVQLHRM